jgi:hypothetical protein
VRLRVDPCSEGDARGLEHLGKVVGGCVVRLGANLAQGLLERESEVDGDPELVGHLRVAPARERSRRGSRARRTPSRSSGARARPSDSWGRPGTRARSDPRGSPGRSPRSRVHLDRTPTRTHAVHVGVGERPVLARGHDPELDEPIDVRGGHASPLSQLLRVARAHGGRMIFLTTHEPGPCPLSEFHLRRRRRGTGFGGVVATCRLAQAGVDVAGLEALIDDALRGPSPSGSTGCHRLPEAETGTGSSIRVSRAATSHASGRKR